MYRIISFFIFCLYFQFINAAPKATEIVASFGNTLSSWCKTDDISCRESLEKLCSGLKSCRVEDKILADYLFLKGQPDHETFCLDSYLNMFENVINDNVSYSLSNITLETEDKFPNGQVLSFVTADVQYSGARKYNVRNLFLVRGDKISGIYNYSSKYGFNHLNGSLIEALKKGDYSYITSFDDGYATVGKDGRYGLIDLKGNVIIPCIWDAIEYSQNGCFARGYNYKETKSETNYDLRYNGKKMPFYMKTFIVGREKIPTTFSEGYAVVMNDDDKYGFLKEDDLTYSNVDFKYDDATRFCDGYAFVKINGRTEIIDKKFKTILKDNASFKIIDRPYEGLVKVMNINRKFGFMDLKGKLVIPFVFDNVENFVNGLAQVENGDWSNRKVGFINKSGEFAIPMTLNGCWSVGFEDGYVEVSKDITSDYYRNGKVEKVTEHKATLMGTNGEPIPGFGWDYYDVRRFCDGLARFKDTVNGKYGFLNTKGEVAILPTYSFAQFFVDGYSCVGIVDDKGNHKYGSINKDGVLVIPYIYDKVFYFNGGVANVVKDGKAGLIDAFGNSTFNE